MWPLIIIPEVFKIIGMVPSVQASSQPAYFGNHWFAGIFQDTHWAVAVAVAATVAIFTCIYLFFRKKTSSVYAVILCTILLSQLDQGKYVIQIDILPKEKAEEKKKKRREKGFVSKADVFMGGGKSPDFKVNVDSVITFQTDGALKPMTEFKQGQNLLKCVNIKTEEISRQIHLVPDVTSPDDHASVSFHLDGEFLHQVNITKIFKDETLVKEVSSVRSTTSSSSGYAETPGNQVLPLPPRHQQDSVDGVVSVRTGQRDNSDADGNIGRRRSQSRESLEASGSSSLGLEEHNFIGGVFSSKSLQALSKALAPKDSRRLLVYLGLEENDINYELHDNPRDSAQAYANLFKKWKEKDMHIGKNAMINKMLLYLQDIQRNDIKIIFERFANENCELKPSDFHGIN